MPGIQPVHRTVFRTRTGGNGPGSGRNWGFTVDIEHIPDAARGIRTTLLQREALQADRSRPAAAFPVRFAARFADEYRGEVSRPCRSHHHAAPGELA